MLAVIGGTGIYELAGMQVEQRLDEPTPFGTPSGRIVKGRLGGRELLFLARHGAGHKLLPHEVNYRANIFALKRAGATQILGFSAVGSLAQQIAPGRPGHAQPVLRLDQGRPRAQLLRRGRGRACVHRAAGQRQADRLGRRPGRGAWASRLHRDVTYACVEGPRLGTRAESLFMRQVGCQLVGMTNVPEVFLAREAQICYATVCIATDYDCWMDDPAMHVSVSAILAKYRESLDRARALLDALLAGPLPEEEPEIRSALQYSMLTPDEALSDAQREWLAVLRR